VRLHYNRASKAGAVALDHATKLAAALGWTPPGLSIGIFGAGFSWTAEALETLGYLTALGLDVSNYIQSEKDNTEDADIDSAITAVGLDPATGEGLDIKNRVVARGGGVGNRTRATRGVLDESGGNPGSRGRIKQALGLSGNDQIEWTLSESVIESLTDGEVLAGSNDLNIIGINVVHFVHTLRSNQDAGYNWKTLEDWKTLIPGDTFIEAGTYRVL
jgi:hypothetical protein